MRSLLRAVALVAGAASAFAAEADPALPPYAPREIAVPQNAGYLTPAGAISVTGYNDMAEMLQALGHRFAALHPGIRFAWDLPGTKAAPAALAAGISAFAPMGAPMTPPQLAAYEKITRAPPLVFRVAHGSLSPRAEGGPLAIFVHRDNPLASLTLAEVAAIFSGADRARGLRPIGILPDAALGLFVRERVLGGRAFGADYVALAQSRDVVQQVGEDVRAIGFGSACRATPAVKMLALAERAGAPAFAANDENVMSGRYPLDRHLLICTRAPLDPLAREFLRFALSRDGQRLVAAGTLGYLPLSARDAAVERVKLEAVP